MSRAYLDERTFGKYSFIYLFPVYGNNLIPADVSHDS